MRERVTHAVRTLRDEPVSVVVALLVAVQVVFRLLTVSKSYFWQDDFVHMAQSQHAALSWNLLVRDYNDHLEILPNTLYWVMSRLPTLSFWPSTILITVIQLGVSILMWLVLRRMFGPRPLLLVPFAGYLFTPLWVAGTVWLAAAVEALPLQAAMLGALFCMLKWQESQSIRWALGSAAAALGGVLCWEKGLAIAPFLLALQLLILSRGLPWRQRVALLRDGRRLWILHAVVWIGFLALYLRVVDGSERGGGRDAVGPLEAVHRSVLEVFLPGLYGSPWNTSQADNTIYPAGATGVQIVTALVVLSVVCLSLWWLGRGAIAAWFLIGGYLAADVALLVWGRISYLSLVAADPRYVLDAVLVACIGIAAAFVRTQAERAREPNTSPRAPERQMELTVAAPLAVVLAASCLLTAIQLSPVAERTFSRAFVSGLLSQFDRYPDRSVVDTEVTHDIGYVTHRQLLETMGRDAPFNRPGTSMYMFNGLAEMRPIQVLNKVLDARGSKPDCGWAIGAEPTTLGSIQPRQERTDLVLRLGYVTGVDATVQLRVGSGPWQHLDLVSGYGYAWFVAPSQSGAVEVRVEQRQAAKAKGICISDALAGKPWPVG